MTFLVIVFIFILNNEMCTVLFWIKKKHFFSFLGELKVFTETVHANIIYFVEYLAYSVYIVNACYTWIA